MEINYTLEMENGPFCQLLSFAEAAEIWGLDPSALRKAISDGRLIPNQDCRKFGKQWVVTVSAMAKTFGHGQNSAKYNITPWTNFIYTLRKQQSVKDFTLQ